MKFQLNDGGREAAGFKGSASDCVVRSVAIATGLPYLDVYNALKEVNSTKRGKRKGQSPREGVFTKTTAFKRYMASLGWSWVPCMGIGTGCTVHLHDGELPSGTLIVAVSRHYTTVVDGVIHDMHDPSRGGTRCVYGYWTHA